ncbi:MAG: bacteriocin fulvocin C-related protein [Bacteroidales bacterium]|nr:bacteriocin fulvocin C-related protein [Bacteroidales bacterium]
MRKIRLKIAGLIILSSCFILTGCNNSEDSKSECSKRLEKYLLNDEIDPENLTRAEWLELPDSLQDVAYLSMNSVAKHLFWLDKVDEVRNNYRWSSDESDLLDSLYSYIENQPNLFTDRFYSDTLLWNEFLTFESDWLHQADSIGMAKATQFGIIAHGGELTDILNRLNNAEVSNALGLCDCSTVDDWCWWRKSCHTSGACFEDKRNCGFLWLKNCDGICY